MGPCETLRVVRLGLLLAVVGALTAGCIDVVEWESSGFPVEEVEHALEEEHHVSHPAVECIQREAQGAKWECRTTSGTEYECEVHVGIRERIKSIHCHGEHAEEEEPEQEEEHEPEAEATHPEE